MCELGTCSKDIETMIRPLAQQKNITLTLDCPFDSSERYLIDAIHLQQIIVNLLSNAVKFTPENGFVTMKAGTRDLGGGEYLLTISVTDTGIGISKEFQKRAFEPFTQEHSGNTSPYPGTGIGLFISKRLARLMGGDITCESVKGEGCTFTVSVPTRKSEYEGSNGGDSKDGPDPNHYRNEEEFDLSGLEILLCEDHPLNQKITKALLERKGCNVTIAPDGAVGVDMFRESEPGHFAAVLMDIRMPVLDGLSAARKIRLLDREDAGSVPVIAMSANAYEEDVQKSLDAGMDAHLAKPVEAKKLYRTIAKYTGR
jgi:CheY-like chemotaxis protein